MEIVIFIIFLIVIIGIIVGIVGSSSKTITTPPPAPRIHEGRTRIGETPELRFPLKPEMRNPDFVPLNRKTNVPRPPETAFKAKPIEYFTSGKTKTDPAAPCFITGQPISSCACAECKGWRKKRVD